MVWGMFDDRYPANLKVRRLSDRAFRLDVTGILWSCGQLSDGQIFDLDDLPGVKGARRAVAELVERGRWHEPGHGCTSEHCRPIDEGWLIHDWREFNRSRERVLADRKAAAARQKRWRSKTTRGDGGRYASRDAGADASGHALRHAVPVPTPKGVGTESPLPAPRPVDNPAGGRWCGKCSDPVLRREIDRESGSVTTNPCPRCGARSRGTA